ncbi:MAG: hypothetical protein CM1200mP39_18310 [Dehalococcoidia bacterium]|nr:MAG: hypothetical protein CM1200mP39_18310 [Dehalococcoidia bacterium]
MLCRCPAVAYREPVTKVATAQGKLVRQTGGQGNLVTARFGLSL